MTAVGAHESPSTNSSHRRARSLSRFWPHAEYKTAPKGTFVNTKRGSEFPEISLDDLALELFNSPQDKELREGRAGTRSREAGELGRWASDTASSKRRGRSVSRQMSGGGSHGRSKILDNSRRRRRRSVSVVRYQVSDSESHSTASTDDDTRGSHVSKFGTERTIQAVYAKKSEHPTGEVSTELYEAMRKELRHAVEEIWIEVQQAMGKGKANLEEDKTDYDHVLSIIPEQKCATKFTQSEKHKHDLLAELKLEELQVRDLSKIIKEMVFSSKNSVAPQKPAWTRLRSNDTSRMSNQPVEEADKYFENFASNVEDTDISSFDGKRSDASSAKGGTINANDRTEGVEAQSYHSPAGSSCHPTGADGIILPWLQWETSHNSSLLGKSIRQPPETPKSLERNDKKDLVTLMDEPRSDNSKSSCGSYSPGIVDVCLEATKEDNSRSNLKESGGCKKSQFDMEEYRELQTKEELLFERYKERQRIDYGGLLLCAGNL